MNRFIFNIELLIHYYSENFGIQVIFGDHTAFSIVNLFKMQIIILLFIFIILTCSADKAVLVVK